MVRGQRIYINTGELSFETSPQTAGTYPGIFLEYPKDETGQVTQEYCKVINRHDRIQVVHRTLVSRFSI